jgi:hypothetical protein
VAEGNGDSNRDRFEAVQFVEPDFVPGIRYEGPIQTRVGAYPTEEEAVAAARAAWQDGRAHFPKRVAWWIVRRPGEELARWIADSRSPQEKFVDLTSKALLDSPPR